MHCQLVVAQDRAAPVRCTTVCVHQSKAPACPLTPNHVPTPPFTPLLHRERPHQSVSTIQKLLPVHSRARQGSMVNQRW